MENFIKTLLYLCLLTLFGCKQEKPVSFFGSVLNCDEVPKFHGHDANWLTVSGLKEIYYVNIPAEKSAQKIRKTLGKIVPKEYLVNEVVTAFIFTTNQDTSQVNITFEKVHALGLVRQQGTDFYFEYMENRNNRFVSLPELSGNINAGIDMDDLRLLHFVSSPGKNLPPVSTIFDFRMNPLQPFTRKGKLNKSIGDAVLINMNLNKGMNTLDIYGENFYSAMRINDSGQGSFCGGNGHCPSGTARCIYPPAGPDKVCDAPSGGESSGCLSAMITYAEKVFNSDKLPFDLVGLFAFKDSFLMKYPKGQQFVAYMYLTGRYMRKDKDAMDNYLNLILAGEKAIRKIQGEEDDVVLFDSEYVDIFSTFIQNHRNPKNEKLDLALSVLEADLDRIQGFTRTQFLRYMNESTIREEKYK